MFDSDNASSACLSPSGAFSHRSAGGIGGGAFRILFGCVPSPEAAPASVGGAAVDEELTAPDIAFGASWPLPHIVRLQCRSSIRVLQFEERVTLPSSFHLMIHSLFPCWWFRPTVFKGLARGFTILELDRHPSARQHLIIL